VRRRVRGVHDEKAPIRGGDELPPVALPARGHVEYLLALGERRRQARRRVLERTAARALELRPRHPLDTLAC
jgi:hypothetical protein